MSVGFPVTRYRFPILVMPGLVPGIHVFLSFVQANTWMAGTSPAMTMVGWSS